MTAPPTCPRCGSPKPEPESPHGLCPRCVLAASLGFEGSVVLEDTSAAQRELPPAPTIEELAPHFPQLTLDTLIARGGMGAVYKAKQTQLDRVVALKVLDPGIASRPGFAERFAREAKALAQLAHPGIVTVHEYGQAGPWFYFVMEFVDGTSLRQMIRAKSVAPREALSIVMQTCDALQFAHDRGVVHRDVKPENVLVTRRGQVKVLDFGLAKVFGRGDALLTRTSQVMGTPHYMAPEQWERPLEVDHRADIFALGVVFYELLTGELPLGRFPAPSKKVELDVRLDGVVLRTLEKEPELRYQQASDVRVDVERIRDTPSEARAETSASRAPAANEPRGQELAPPEAPPVPPGHEYRPGAFAPPPPPLVADDGVPARLRHRARYEAKRAARDSRGFVGEFLRGLPTFVLVLVALHALAAVVAVIATLVYVVAAMR
ncbi:MAG: serine/threonine protein kinase [Planctomycetes bacterium]|nr:serine/threonine protein kinase [Planctomycetota bacterium]